jgi:hypothetical protein
VSGIQFHPVNKVKHYNLHSSGVECIEVVRHLSFGVGNAVKYVWRATNKGTERHDLEKTLYYLDDEAAIADESVSFYLGGNADTIVSLAQRYADAEENPDRANAVLHLVKGALVLGDERRDHFARARVYVQNLLEKTAPTE